MAVLIAESQKKYTCTRQLPHHPNSVNVVYEVRTPSGAPAFAKIVSESALQSDELLGRFRHEIFITQWLSGRYRYSPQFVDSGVFKSRPFFVTELLRGHTFLDKKRAQSPLAQMVGYLLDACRALDELHQQGFVHRDVKPSNLFVVESPPRGGGRIKVIDFGVAKIVEQHQPSTVPNVPLGTPEYSSPEQYRDASRVNEKADVWSLGVMLHELLLGKRLVHGKPDMKAAELYDKELAAAIEDALLEEPVQRCSTGKLSSYLEQWLAGKGIKRSPLETSPEHVSSEPARAPTPRRAPEPAKALTRELDTVTDDLSSRNTAAPQGLPSSQAPTARHDDVPTTAYVDILTSRRDDFPTTRPDDIVTARQGDILTTRHDDMPTAAYVDILTSGRDDVPTANHDYDPPTFDLRHVTDTLTMSTVKTSECDEHDRTSPSTTITNGSGVRRDAGSGEHGDVGSNRAPGKSAAEPHVHPLYSAYDPLGPPMTRPYRINSDWIRYTFMIRKASQPETVDNHRYIIDLCAILSDKLTDAFRRDAKTESEHIASEALADVRLEAHQYTRHWRPTFFNTLTRFDLYLIALGILTPAIIVGTWRPQVAPQFALMSIAVTIAIWAAQSVLHLHTRRALKYVSAGVAATVFSANYFMFAEHSRMRRVQALARQSFDTEAPQAAASSSIFAPLSAVEMLRLLQKSGPPGFPHSRIESPLGTVSPTWLQQDSSIQHALRQTQPLDQAKQPLRLPREVLVHRSERAPEPP